MENIRSWVGPLVDGKCKYYQDRSKRWPFYTGDKGYKLLQRLLEANEKLLAKNEELILKTDDPDKTRREGYEIYSHKPTLKSRAGVTWSVEEYEHPGLQGMYLRMKSFQRYTETYSLLERACYRGLFREYQSLDKSSNSTVRVASIGGGPAYELLALRHFFEEKLPFLTLNLTSLDICKSWGMYAEPLGFNFLQWDINDGDLLSKLNLSAGQLDYVVISYVFIYCTNDRACDFLQSLLSEGKVKAILVSERSEATEACTMMEKRGVRVERLMTQKLGKDERQNLFLGTHTDVDKTPKKEETMTFPNVPFEEHKEPRQAKGHRLGWRPFHDDTCRGHPHMHKKRGVCFAHQKGHCYRGKTCKYLHQIPPKDSEKLHRASRPRLDR